MLPLCSNWKVDTKRVLSDHNLIVFELNMKTTQKRVFKMQDSYNIKKANWEEFSKDAKDKFTKEIHDKLYNINPERAVKLFNETLTNICKYTIPRKRKCSCSVPMVE